MPGFTGYFINPVGHIVSVRGRQPARGRKKPRPLAVRRGNNGWWHVYLFHTGTARRPYPVRSLVALAFLGPKPPGTHLYTLDKDPGNHCLDNLAYLTHAEAVRRGVVEILRGERLGAKLTAARVVAARRRAHAGERPAALAREMGVEPRSMYDVLRCKTWRHVDAGVPPWAAPPRRPVGNYKLTAAQVAAIRAAYAAGRRVCDIHRDGFAHLSYPTVRNCVRDLIREKKELKKREQVPEAPQPDQDFWRPVLPDAAPAAPLPEAG